MASRRICRTSRFAATRGFVCGLRADVLESGGPALLRDVVHRHDTEADDEQDLQHRQQVIEEIGVVGGNPVDRQREENETGPEQHNGEESLEGLHTADPTVRGSPPRGRPPQRGPGVLAASYAPASSAGPWAGRAIASLPLLGSSDLSAAIQLYSEVSVIQLVWSDSAGRLPWDLGSDPEPDGQPQMGRWTGG